jgi:hypothetical protein
LTSIVPLLLAASEGLLNAEAEQRQRLQERRLAAVVGTDNAVEAPQVDLQRLESFEVLNLQAAYPHDGRF